MIQSSERIQFRVSFSSHNAKLGLTNRLSFKLAKYDINGTFFGFEELSNQLMICDMPAEEVDRVFGIGNTVQSQCVIDLSQLIDSRKLN